MRQKNQVELNLGTGAEGEARSAAARESEARTARTCLERPAVAGLSMEAVVERENLKEALAQVKRNKGAAGNVRARVPCHPPPPQEAYGRIRAQVTGDSNDPAPHAGPRA